MVVIIKEEEEEVRGDGRGQGGAPSRLGRIGNRGS